MKNPRSEQTHVAQSISIQLGEEPEAAESRSETERLKEEIERLNHELRREHEMYVRNLADFDNYRRRAERERAQAAQAGKRDLIMPLLEVMDDFERALQHAHDDTQSLAMGLRAVYRHLAGLLASEGVTRDLDNYRRLSREHAEIGPVVELFGAYRRTLADI